MTQRVAWFWFCRLVMRRVSRHRRPGLNELFHDAWHLATYQPRNLWFRLRHPLLMARVDHRVRLKLKGIETLDA